MANKSTKKYTSVLMTMNEQGCMTSARVAWVGVHGKSCNLVRSFCSAIPTPL